VGEGLSDPAGGVFGSALTGEEAPQPVAANGGGGVPGLVVRDDLAPLGLLFFGYRSGDPAVGDDSQGGVALGVPVGLKVGTQPHRGDPLGRRPRRNAR
jgi:hypothetical protein